MGKSNFEDALAFRFCVDSVEILNNGKIVLDFDPQCKRYTLYHVSTAFIDDFYNETLIPQKLKKALQEMLVLYSTILEEAKNFCPEHFRENILYGKNAQTAINKLENMIERCS